MSINTASRINLPPVRFEFQDVPTFDGRTQGSVERMEPVFSQIDQAFNEYKMYENSDINNENWACAALAGNQEVSLFTKLFFSKANIEELQRLIRYNVYLKSGKKHIIDNQSVAELVIIMRSVYFQYGRVEENPKKIKEALAKLNTVVVNQLLPYLLSHIEQYLGYIRDSSAPYYIMDKPEIVSSAGTKTLRSTTDVLIGDDRLYN